MEPVSYQIDSHDDIASLSDSWTAFAVSNGAPHLAAHVLGHSLWEFVGDVTTCQVYQNLLVRVRGGRTVTFSYRCDSPSLRRFMQMTMTPRARNGVRFDSVTLRTESRAPLSLDTAQRGMLLRECSWCKRVAVGDDWVEVELAVERLGLFGDGTPSAITHGMCPPCFTRVVEELEVV